MTIKKSVGITGSTLKLIAIITMFIDHVGGAVLEYFLRYSPALQANQALYRQIYLFDRVLRSIGRLSFPIFCFLLVEGFLHTRNVKKYAFRLFLFALLSEIPFDLAFFNKVYDPLHQNVFFTLLIGLFVMIGVKHFKKSILLQTLCCAVGLFAGYFLNTDYGYKGVFLIIVLYYTTYDRLHQSVAGAIAIGWEQVASFSFFPIYFYNGKRGLSLRYFFYLFYPVHLLLLSGIARFLMPLLPSIFHLGA